MKADLQKLWAETQANGDRRDACPGPHVFEDITPDKVIAKQHRCKTCGGTADGQYRAAYEKGLDHAREAAARARFSVNAGPSLPLHSTISRIEEYVGEAQAARAIPMLLALQVNGGLDIHRGPHITRIT